MSTEPFTFTVGARSGSARTGVFETPHGPVRTPAFMPVGTRGTIKAILPELLPPLGTEMVLANAYHLHLRPGADVVADLGGLHRLMNWSGPILTDSGGYQTFSISEGLRADDEGVTMRSVVDGDMIRLTPELMTDVQLTLGADVIMAFDHCPGDPTDRSAVEGATRRTSYWLERCVERWRAAGGVETGSALFGIVQGGSFDDLREESALDCVHHDLPGYAIGGVSVGEEKSNMDRATAAALPHLPADRPRYLMGIGTPRDCLEGIARGVDLFDCVTPTRHGRNHRAFTREGQINLRNQRFQRDDAPLEADCGCPACRGYSRGALRHLCNTGEMLAGVLLTLHNVRFFHRLFENARAAIEAGTFDARDALHLMRVVDAPPGQRRR